MSGVKKHIFKKKCNFVEFQYTFVLKPKPFIINPGFMGINLLFNYEILYRKDDTLFAVHSFKASPQSSRLHLTTFLLAQLQFFQK